jgi:putative hydrolase of the HAD superfamily
MDNTLFDFIHAQQSACKAVLTHLGQDADPDNLFSYFRRPIHGFEHHGNIRDFLTDHELLSDRLFEECCEIYEREKVASIRPYPGVTRMLGSLMGNGLPLGIITDAETPLAGKRLDKAGLSRFFTTVVSPDRSGARKPAPASFQLALKELHVQPEQTVLAGDSIRRDIIPAQKIGMVTIYAQYGDWFRTTDQEYCTPDFVAGSVAEMEQVLITLTKS